MKPLEEYAKKRDFRKTAEPPPRVKRSGKPIFVVQEHHASHLHFDFRLEVNGVLKSWSVPKGPSLNPKEKRLAVEVEDHPLEYAKFEGEIPAGEYGGGTVYRWDTGSFHPVGDPEESIRRGRLEFTLEGEKLKGAFLLIRTRGGKGKPQWLLIKRTDEFARELSPGVMHPESSASPEPARARPKRAAVLKKRKTASSKSALPEFVPPQLALLVEAPPTEGHWIHELKYDGYRILARVDESGARLLTRNEQDWTDRYPVIARALKPLQDRGVILDGEVVWVNEDGSYDFQRLQNALNKTNGPGSLAYFVFDLLYLDGEDLRPLPLLERKAKLRALLEPMAAGPVLYSGHMEEDGAGFLAASCGSQLEGIVSKRADSPYVGGRVASWVKSKCQLRQEFVVAGFTEEKGSRVGFGALLLAVQEEGGLRYVGKVGTGFNRDSLLELRERFRKLEQKANPFAPGKGPKGKGFHWLSPKLVAEISFAQWTNDRMVRVPVFQGLREDKPARDVKEERAARKVPLPPEEAARSYNSEALSHPDKILFKKEKITKRDVSDYYQAVGAFLLPHIERRPLSLLRCPAGVDAACFMQKHLKEAPAAGIAPVKVKEAKGTSDYIQVTGPAGLTSLVQKGVLELHPWGSREGSLDKPDQVVMDFDPDPTVNFKRVIGAARLLKSILSDLGLQSFVKVTGGKGLHVHVPLRPVHSWEEVKAFAETLTRELISREPKLFTKEMAKAARKGKIFVDYLRNAAGATAVAPYSLRAKEISSVALPVEWEELGRLKASNQFTLKKALAKVVGRKRDPWEQFFLVRQKIDLLENAA